MTGTRRTLLLGAAALAALGADHTQAAEYPKRPVRIIVPFAPAGLTDIMARVVAAQLSERMGGSFIVENHAGAGGNIGCGLVARAEPDGHALLIHSSSLVVNPGLYKKLPYDPVKDFAPLVELATSPNIFVANKNAGLASIGDVIARAKADPMALSYASAGIGSTPHLSGEWLKFRTGIQMVHVPYAGAGPGMEAVLSGTTQLACLSLPSVMTMVSAGELVALAVTGKTRWPSLPAVPTMLDLGFDGFVTDVFQAFMAPAKTPQPIIDALVANTLALLADPAVHALLAKEGFDVLANGPSGMARRIADEVPMWRALITEAGIAPV